MIKKILKYIIITILLFFFSGYLFYTCYFLRSPERNIPNDNTKFVSPANGEIIAIIRYDEKLKTTTLYKKNNVVLDDWRADFETGATLISIMMTPMDVHYQKAPLSSKFLTSEYKAGNFFNAMKKGEFMKSTFQNEHNIMNFITPEGYKFRIIQIAGFLARRIVDFLEPNQALIQGEKIGLIKLGSQVSIVVDKNFQVIAKVGDKVIDGETVLARKK
ncbi:MAG: phosphatidylserine decarboxylase family protein [candidate division SR1 bacterium]|nr:MAG: phosphatidylserine decarboxylase family protein [candidate division SR1 bacterium]